MKWINLERSKHYNWSVIFVGLGLSCIAVSCSSLKVLSLAKNKQLQDSDFEIAFKTGFNNLISLDISYSSLTGQCFNNLNCPSMRKINVNCSSRLKTKGALILLTRVGNTLQHLDLSVTKIDDDFFNTLRNFNSNAVKTLYLDFCESISLLRLQESLPESFPSLKVLSIFGIASTCERGKFCFDL